MMPDWCNFSIYKIFKIKILTIRLFDKIKMRIIIRVHKNFSVYN